jgi:hypothetical protein
VDTNDLGFKINDKLFVQGFISYIFIWIILIILFRIFDYLIKPSYFEANITNGQIIIKTFNPNRNNKFRFILMLFFDKYLIEQIIDRHFYNNYKILIDYFGLRKKLILQKIDNGKIYESKPINISFLGTKKYTDLILSIDRIKEKITMN